MSAPWIECWTCEGTGRMDEDEEGRSVACGVCRGRRGWVDPNFVADASDLKPSPSGEQEVKEPAPPAPGST